MRENLCLILTCRRPGLSKKKELGLSVGRQGSQKLTCAQFAPVRIPWILNSNGIEIEQVTTSKDIRNRKNPGTQEMQRIVRIHGMQRILGAQRNLLVERTNKS